MSEHLDACRRKLNLGDFVVYLEAAYYKGRFVPYTGIIIGFTDAHAKIKFLNPKNRPSVKTMNWDHVTGKLTPNGRDPTVKSCYLYRLIKLMVSKKELEEEKIKGNET